MSSEPELPVVSYEVQTTLGRRAFGTGQGYVLPHEHILTDLRVYWEGAGKWNDLDSVNQTLRPSMYDAHRRLPQGTSRENLVLSDWFLAAQELIEAKDNGCQLIVDLTVQGLSPQISLASQSAEMAGLPLVYGIGRYLGHALTEEQTSAKVDQVASEWLEQVRDGVDGHSVGIIGEIGTSAQIQKVEEVSLRAAAHVQYESKLPLNIHVDPFGRQGHTVLDILERENADLSKVALSHCDGDIDIDWLVSLCERGVYVEFDLFGTGHEWKIMGRGFNNDYERLDAVCQLVELGWSESLLLSHDICMRNSLIRHGGWGYGHLGRTILPELERRVGPGMREVLTSTNPLRYLSVN